MGVPLHQQRRETMMKHNRVRLTLVVLEAFVALTSIACGVGLMVGAVEFPVAWLAGTAFSDYTMPGLVMATVVGWQFVSGRRNDSRRARRRIGRVSPGRASLDGFRGRGSSDD